MRGASVTTPPSRRKKSSARGPCALPWPMHADENARRRSTLAAKNQPRRPRLPTARQELAESALATPGHLLRTDTQQTAEARGAWATTLMRRGPMSSLERTLRAGPLDPALPACASVLRRRAPAQGRRGRRRGAISPRPTDFALLRAAEAAHVQAEAALACVSCGRLRTQRGWRASGKGSRPCATGRDAPRTTQRPPSSDHSWQQTANRLHSTHPHVTPTTLVWRQCA